MIGQSRGHYRFLEKLGAGGMGEVYRAEDTTLGREVAIKVLPEVFTGDAERLARFEREAKLLATLNHPHVAQIHALEEVDGQKLLVMELVEGDTLGERLAQGPMAVEESLRLAVQITEALETAHERGIVHRDLKPANIKLTTGGEVKVLDFGLAKPVTDAAAGDLTHSPTLTYSPTQAGVLMGTAAYMSPEQARGQEVDKRSDIWAFGVVLWEMLTGERLFDGETVSDILAAVLRAEPDWRKLPAETPPAILKVLRRCLTRDPKNRLHDIADARLEFEESLREPELVPGTSPAEPTPRPNLGTRFVWMLTGVVAAAMVGFGAWFWTRPEPSAPAIRRYHLQPPSGVAISPADTPLGTMALSRDGEWVAFVGQEEDPPHRSRIYLRSVAELEAHPVAGTENGWNPFFSPDSQWLGFEVGGLLKRVPVAGGEPLVICEAPRLRGASWGQDGSILLSARGKGLFRVIPEEGESELVAVPNPDSSEDRVLKWPQHLPDGRSALVMVTTGFLEARQKIAVLSLETGKYRTLLTGGTYPRYVPGGFIVFLRLGTLYAVAFDPERLEISGEPQPALDDVYFQRGSGFGALAVSETGSLVYEPGAPRMTDSELVWIDRKGTIEPVVQDRQPYGDVSLSADGHRLVATIYRTLQEHDLWTYDLGRENWNRLTHSGTALMPYWSPDNRWIVYSAESDGAWRLFRIPADGSSDPVRLTNPGTEWEFPISFSPDGGMLAFERFSFANKMDILLLPLGEAPGTESPYLSTPAGEENPAISPDGHWLAYESDESGRSEVYMRPFPGPGGRTKISTDGGRRPRWHPQGRELFYQERQTIWAVPVETTTELVVGRPEPLVELDFRVLYQFQVSPNGRRFLVVRPAEEKREPLRLVYVPEWSAELAHLMAAEP